VNPAGKLAMLGPAIRIAAPWKIPSVPRVAISALTRALATSRPFAMPPAAAIAIPAVAAAIGGQPALTISQPATTPTSDSSDPTDRSNAPPIISVIIPTARMPSTAILFKTTRKLA